MQVGGLLSGVETGELFTCATSPDERAGRAGTSTCHPSHTPPLPPYHPPSNPSLSHHFLSPPFPSPHNLLTSPTFTAVVGYSPLINYSNIVCVCMSLG